MYELLSSLMVYGLSVTFFGNWMMYKTSHSTFKCPANFITITYAESIETICFSNGSIYGHSGLKDFCLPDMGK
jgi:hypothetical protein